MTKRYIGNLETGLYHDTLHLSERCNTDALHRSGNMMEFDEDPGGTEVPRLRARANSPLNWRRCQHDAKIEARAGGG